ncbi:MAG TPA: hypothetical protein VGR92_03780 [Steroidobacteraceae bacterium]|nr:hypothetical protein [Steroidobacteraceae bacterium]
MSAFRLLVLVLMLARAVATVFAQDDNPSSDHVTLTPNGSSASLDIYSGRPVSDAVGALAKRYGYVITYEDPQYVYSDDVTDATAYVRKDHRASGAGAPQLMLPRGGELSMQIPTSLCIPPSQMASTLQQLVDLPASRGGHFRMEQTKSGAMFHVIPTEVRDRNGTWSAQALPLDARISFPALPRTEDQLLATIVGAVSATAHVNMDYVIDGGVVIGIPPRNPFQFNIGADDETARDVLTRMFEARPDRKQTWALLNAVEDGPNEYELNVMDLPPSAGCQTPKPPLPPPPTQGFPCISCAPSPARPPSSGN